MRGRKRGSVIGLAIAMLLILLGGWVLWHGWRWEREIEGFRSAEIGRMSVDLSVKGEYQGRLDQMFTMSHGQALGLRTVPTMASPEEALERLRGLSADLIVRRADGSVEWQQRIDAPESSGSLNWEPDRVQLAHFPVLRRASYDVVLRVNQPATMLRDRQQQVFQRYLLCGSEFVPARLGKMIGQGVIGIGVVIALACCYRLRWSRRADRLG